MSDDHSALEDLSHRLWDERRIVTHLLYKLTVTRLLLAADERRFVADAIQEVEQTVELLRAGELARDEALRALAAGWTTDPQVLTLEELARRSPSPFSHTFTEHLAAFRDLAAEIEHTARENRVLARSDLQVVAGQLEQLTGTRPAEATTYGATGRLDPSAGVGARLREVL